MASKKRERCERWRAATDAPWLMNVEVDDSTPNAGRLVPVPMAGAACATANGRPRAVLSPGPRPRTDLRLQVSCTNTSILGGRLEYVFWNTCGIRSEYCEYGQNTALWEVIWNTWNTYSDRRNTSYDMNASGLCLSIRRTALSALARSKSNSHSTSKSTY